MGPIVLLKNFTLAIASGQIFRTEWISLPSEHMNMDMHVHVQGVVPTGMASGFAVGLEGGFAANLAPARQAVAVIQQRIAVLAALGHKSRTNNAGSAGLRC